MYVTEATLPPFQVLLDSYREDVYRFLVASAGREEADDAFQETFLSAMRAYPRLEHGDNLRGWILQIAHRKAVDSHRARGRRPLPVAEAPEEAAPERAAPDGEPPLMQAVRALPPKQRGAILCRSLLGLDYDEVAAALGCSEPAARRSVHEGLKRLREEWSHE
jgi:RNA polymerase sigma factor (sigma-70 family)